MNGERGRDTHTAPRVKQTEGGICCVTQGAEPGFRDNREGWGGRAKREGTCVHLRLTPVAVWQSPTQYCKAIILQLSINLKSNFKEKDLCHCHLSTQTNTEASLLCPQPGTLPAAPGQSFPRLPHHLASLSSDVASMDTLP